MFGFLALYKVAVQNVTRNKRVLRFINDVKSHKHVLQMKILDTSLSCHLIASLLRTLSFLKSGTTSFSSNYRSSSSPIAVYNLLHKILRC
jgi:hypothetical protein